MGSVPTDITPEQKVGAQATTPTPDEAPISELTGNGTRLLSSKPELCRRREQLLAPMGRCPVWNSGIEFR